MTTKQPLSVRDAMREREKGRKWARGLQMYDVHQFLDQNVLGDYDWREWFDKKPTGVFVNAAFDECQFREELGK